MKTPNIKQFVFATIAAFAFTQNASAQTNIAVGAPSGAARNDTYPAAGIGFYAPAAGTTVNALGFWDATSTGLLASHQVCLYQYAGTGSSYNLMATVVIPAGTVAPLVDGYRWVGIPTTTLPNNGQGGNYYVILASQGSDTWSSGIDNTPDMNPAIGTISGSGLFFNSNPSTLGEAQVTIDNEGGVDGYGGPNVGYFNPPLPELGVPVIITNLEPTAVAVPVGAAVAFSIVVSNSPPANLQWQFIANGVTNGINSGVVNVTNNGEVFSTLTLTNLQVTNSGSYQVEAVYAANSSVYIYSDVASLSVNGLINWIQTGAFTDDSVLALVGNPANEVYGVDFGGSGPLTTDNNYTFNDGPSSGDMLIAGSPAAATVYLNGPDGLDTTGDPNLDEVLADGLYGQTGNTGTLENLTVGQAYYVLVLLADTRGSAAGGSVFYCSDGVTFSPGQQYAFTNGVPALGGYMLGQFVAQSTNQPLTVFNVLGGATQYNGILVATSPVPTNAPIYLTSDISPGSATADSGAQVSFSASFGYSPPLNFQWQSVINGVTNTIAAGVVNTTNLAIVTSTLTLSNVSASASGNYRVEAINATNSSDFRYSSFASLTVVAANTWISAGVFTNDSVLTLVGPVSNVVYAVDFGGSGTQTTTNGYTFNDYLATGDVSLSGGSDYGGYMTGGATTGDNALDQVLTFGVYGAGTTGTLNNLTPGQTYNVLALVDDTRGGAAGGEYFIVTDGVTTSPAQQYAFTNGEPYVGGYILGSFTANSSTQPFTVTTSYSGVPGSYYGPQYNAVILATAPATPTLPMVAAPGVIGGNLVLTGTGGTPGRGYTLLQTTNLAPPVVWTTNVTGTLDGTGSFSNSIPILAGHAVNIFFRLRMP